MKKTIFTSNSRNNPILDRLTNKADAQPNSNLIHDGEGVSVKTNRWLPEGKQAAIVWSIDDIHPSTSKDAYEAGGDLEAGALGHVIWILERHQELKVTLFTTADWRQISPFPTKRRAKFPVLRDHFYLADVLPKGTMSLENHRAFVDFINKMERTEVALHGLHHVHKGMLIPVEFQNQSQVECVEKLRSAIEIFERSGVSWTPGIQPPGWNFPKSLESACIEMNLRWVASARDIVTSISPHAVTNMSGMKGVSLIFPQRLSSGLIHITSNFQATNSIERAEAIVRAGGVLSVKAHIVKNACGHVALDGVDRVYMNYLDVLFRELKRKFGDTLWWTTMDEISKRCVEHGCPA